MIKQTIIFLSALVVAVTTGCSGSASPGIHLPDKTQTPTPLLASPLPESTTTPTKISPPIVITSPTTIPTSTVTLTSTLDVRMTVQCLNIAPSLPPETDVEGVLALAGYSFVPDSYLLELKTGTTIPLPRNTDEVLTSFDVTSNRKWLAYYAENFNDNNNSRLVVTAADGKPRLVLPVQKKSWWSLIGWLDNDRLQIDQYREVEYGPYIANPLPLVLFNPFTGEEQEILSDYPDIYNINPVPNWGPFSLIETVYNSSLTMVVYPRAGTGAEVVLWDMKAKQEITHLSGGFSGFGSAPKWSPDNQQFVISHSVTEDLFQLQEYNQDELFSVSREGEIIQLTYLTPYFSKVAIGQYSWSPSGQHIAFWLAVQPDTFPDLPSNLPWVDRLAVLDTVTQQVTLYCIQGPKALTAPSGGSIGFSPGEPIWSPDGSKLLVETVGDGDLNYTVLVDIVHGYAAKIAENVSPMGWMVSEP